MHFIKPHLPYIHISTCVFYCLFSVTLLIHTDGSITVWISLCNSLIMRCCECVQKHCVASGVTSIGTGRALAQPLICQVGPGLAFKIVSRCHIFRLTCTKFNFGWDSAPDIAGGDCSAPRLPIWWRRSCMPLLKNLTPAPGESWPFGPQYSALRAFSPDLTASTPKPKSDCEL